MNPAQEATSRALRFVEATQPPLPMGGCSTWQAHNAHLDAGDPLCENERPAALVIRPVPTADTEATP
jgi:hypothetical protein